MISVITWIDIDGPVMYEAKRSVDAETLDFAEPTRWTLLRLDVGKQIDPEAVPGELLLEDASLADVYQHMQRVLDAQ